MTPTLRIRCDTGAVQLGDRYVLVNDQPLYIVPKGNMRVARTGRRGAGGPKWEALQAFEAAIVLGARRSAAAELKSWDVCGSFRVQIKLLFGTRRVGTPPHTRMDTGHARRRRTGVDNAAKGILDALQGLVWADDEMIDMLAVGKESLPTGTYGDQVLVLVTRIKED